MHVHLVMTEILKACELSRPFQIPWKPSTELTGSRSGRDERHLVPAPRVRLPVWCHTAHIGIAQFHDARQHFAR